MMMQWIKTGIALAGGLQAIIYGIQNIVNWDEAMFFVGSVLGQAGHEAYPGGIVPAIENPALVAITLLVILLLEIGGGLLAVYGAIRMAGAARHREAGAFAAAKMRALEGLGILVLCWGGLFMVGGGALFQMWQTPLGGASLTGAFQYALTSGLFLLIVAQRESDGVHDLTA